MFKTKGLYFIILLIITTILSSCSEYGKLLKTSNYDLKYEKAVEYYNKGDYTKAQYLFDDLRGVYRGTDKAEKIVYYSAYCSYGLREFSLASYLFKEFVRVYPSSEHAEEVEYLAACCLYAISPQSSLEQTFTIAALDDFLLFVNKYPESEKIEEANKRIDELQYKLETKAFNNAYVYYNIMDYKGAVISLKLVLRDNPNTRYREEILFTILKSSFLLAEHSVYSKKYERYKNTIDEYFTFVDNYPNSKKIKDAEKIYNNSLKYINSHGL